MSARIAALVLAALGLMGAGASAAERTPVTIAKQGYLYVGGQKVRTADREVTADAMYVQYQIPARRSRPWPLVLVHGGSATGAAWLGTPDDRQGWAEYFLRLGYAVYMVDQPTRGRSSHDAQIDGPLVRAPAGNVERMFTAPARYNLYPQARLHTQFPGTGLPGDPAYETLTTSLFPAIGGAARTDAINRDALTALLDRIGPAILVTHSRSGPFGWLAADARPAKVKAIVAVEPNGPPFKNASNPGGPSPPSNDERPWGIAYEKLTFDPPVADPAELSPVEEASEARDLSGCWRQGGTPRRRLPNLAGVPILILTGEASYHAQYDHCTSRFLTDAGVVNDFIRLESRGIHGNGHLVMLEKNNLEIAALIDDWLRKKLR
jgi:pimeloyl-ACP methyl ester carboxylesterase